MKRIIFATIVACLGLAATARTEKTEVWANPTFTDSREATGDGFFHTALDLDKVELKEQETVLHMTVRQRADVGNFRIASTSYLLAGGKRYPVISIEDMELDQWTNVNPDGRKNVVMHFQPLPPKTRTFDFMEGDGDDFFKLMGIQPVEERWNVIFPSYWRDDETGDWTAAFLEDCAILQCKVWQYENLQVDSKAGTAKMVLDHQGEKMEVAIGRNKDGRRTMELGGKRMTLSMITSRFMPDYPRPDTCPGFVDNGYRPDTVTISGWVKDMPAKYRGKETFNFDHTDIFQGREVATHAYLDSLGRFTVKIPVNGSSEFFCDWSRCFVRTMLEPGKTYFMLYDFKEGRRLFMGDDARLQNELFRFPPDWDYLSYEKGTDLDRYIDSADSLIRSRAAHVDSLCAANPTLSARFKAFRKGNTLWQQAEAIGQARFGLEGSRLTPRARQYAHDTFWTRCAAEPITLHRGTMGFLRDYIDDAMRESASTRTFNILDHLDHLGTSNEERAVLRRWGALAKEEMARIDAAPTMEEKERIAKEWNTRHADLTGQVDAILSKSGIQRALAAQMVLDELRTCRRLTDSLQAAPIVRDIMLCKIVHDQLEHDCLALPQQVLDTLRTMTDNAQGVAMAEELNNRFLALENREFDRLVLKSSDPLKDLSGGKELLQKIIEPYRGKIVLLDVWGTWCGPCKQALSHSTEEYARLAKYDVVFLYLANNSPYDSWENVVKQYNVSGDNVAHFILPHEQQAAIERYLDVHAFPTYKLFDRQGNLLDLKVDARDLDRLEHIIRQLSR